MEAEETTAIEWLHGYYATDISDGGPMPTAIFRHENKIFVVNDGGFDNIGLTGYKIDDIVALFLHSLELPKDRLGNDEAWGDFYALLCSKQLQVEELIGGDIFRLKFSDVFDD